MHGHSFTLKSWAEFLLFLSVVYAWPLPGATSTWSAVCRKPAVCIWSVAARSKLPCVSMSSVFVILTFHHTHLKFTVYGRKQTSQQANIHMHMRNAAQLVWGSLRLAPISPKHGSTLNTRNKDIICRYIEPVRSDKWENRLAMMV